MEQIGVDFGRKANDERLSAPHGRGSQVAGWAEQFRCELAVTHVLGSEPLDALSFDGNDGLRLLGETNRLITPKAHLSGVYRFFDGYFLRRKKLLGLLTGLSGPAVV